jgi:hypothetical protein
VVVKITRWLYSFVQELNQNKLKRKYLMLMNSKYLKVSESDVTVASARFLGARGWQILSMAMPGGGSGTAFFPNDSNPREGLNGSIVPDLVAKDHNLNVIFFESKPLPSLSDALKLQTLCTPLYKNSLIKILGFSPIRLILGAGFGSNPNSSTEILDELRVKLDFIFVVAKEGSLSIALDKLSLFNRGD